MLVLGEHFVSCLSLENHVEIYFFWCVFEHILDLLFTTLWSLMSIFLQVTMNYYYSFERDTSALATSGVPPVKAGM